MGTLVSVTLIVLAFLSTASIALSWLTRRDVRRLRAAVDKAHPNGYPDPSAAAVVTAPASPRPERDATPELARQRVALRPDPEHGGHDLRAVERMGAAPALGDMLPPAVGRRVVSVTTDDVPIHVRPTREIPPPTSSDQERSDQDALRLDYDAWEEAEAQRARERAERAAAPVTRKASPEKVPHAPPRPVRHLPDAERDALRAKWDAAEDARTRARGEEPDDTRPTVEIPRDSAEELTQVLTSRPGEATAQIPGVPLSSARRAPSSAAAPLPFEEIVGSEDSTPDPDRRPAGAFPAFTADDAPPATPTHPSARRSDPPPSR